MSLLGEIFALITACCWAGGSMAFAAAASRVGSVYVNITRLIIATIVIGIIVGLFGSLYNVTFEQFMFFGFSGVVGFAFGDTFLFAAFETIGARISMVIMSLAPAIAAVLAYLFLKELLSFYGIVGIFVTLVGIILVILDGSAKNAVSNHIPLKGILYAFLGSFGQAGGLTLTKAGFECGPIGGLEATFIRLVTALIIVVPINYFLGLYTQPIKIYRNNKKAFSFTLLGALLGPILGVTFSLLAVSLTKVAIASTLMATTPLFMLPAVWLLQKEKLRWQAILGALLAVGGVILLFIH